MKRLAPLLRQVSSSPAPNRTCEFPRIRLSMRGHEPRVALTVKRGRGLPPRTCRLPFGRTRPEWHSIRSVCEGPGRGSAGVWHVSKLDKFLPAHPPAAALPIPRPGDRRLPPPGHRSRPLGACAGTLPADPLLQCLYHGPPSPRLVARRRRRAGDADREAPVGAATRRARTGSPAHRGRPRRHPRQVTR